MSTFTRTKISFEVLSPEPIPDAMELDTILSECMEGAYLIIPKATNLTPKNISAKQMAKATVEAYSDPSFFNLDTEGNVI